MKTLLLVAFVGCLVLEQTPAAASNAIKWCAVGQLETAKCDAWSSSSVTATGTAIQCLSASSVDECLKRIMHNEADAMAVDGGQVYTAGKCGLVPVMVEQYDQGLCDTTGAASSYYAVAVVKKGSGVTWETLSGKRSCHTGLGKTAGWNMPMGHIYQQTQDCDFTKFFSSGCAPGSEPTSPFCTQCVGNGNGIGKCNASADEQYYGYSGAFRCLVEDAGDVAFIKHTTVGDNTDGNGPSWASAVRSADYELICPGKGPVPISDYASCNLGAVPAHAVVTRPMIRSKVVRILQVQQSKFGPGGSDPSFKLFESGSEKNLLFKDSTKCLQEVQEGTSYDQFLGAEYTAAMTTLRQCSDYTSDLEKSCTS